MVQEVQTSKCKTLSSNPCTTKKKKRKKKDIEVSLNKHLQTL
jgi:hypothetical protein